MLCAVWMRGLLPRPAQATQPASKTACARRGWNNWKACRWADACRNGAARPTCRAIRLTSLQLAQTVAARKASQRFLHAPAHGQHLEEFAHLGFGQQLLHGRDGLRVLLRV